MLASAPPVIQRKPPPGALARRCQRGAAPLPARIVDKSLVSDRVVIDTVIAKYCDPFPHYRQSAILERETGLEISRATLDGWVTTVGQLPIPLTGVMRAELLGGGYVQADERITHGADRVQTWIANREPRPFGIETSPPATEPAADGELSGRTGRSRP